MSSACLIPLRHHMLLQGLYQERLESADCELKRTREKLAAASVSLLLSPEARLLSLKRHCSLSNNIVVQAFTNRQQHRLSKNMKAQVKRLQQLQTEVSPLKAVPAAEEALAWLVLRSGSIHCASYRRRAPLRARWQPE